MDFKIHSGEKSQKKQIKLGNENNLKKISSTKRTGRKQNIFFSFYRGFLR